jgi:hypothetical protein
MLAVLPSSLLGQTPAAILHTLGGVWVNDYEAKDSSAIFAGDVIQTKPGFTANLSLDGSTIVLQQESVAKFQGDFLELDHGSVSVGTSKSFKVRVKCLTVIPVVNEWTQYEVTDVNGSMQVAARKDDVNVDRGADHQKQSAQAETTNGGSVHEGEQKSYEESAVCGAPPRATPAGSVLNPKWIAAGAAGGGVLLWTLLHGSPNPPVSPWEP